MIYSYFNVHNLLMLSSLKKAKLLAGEKTLNNTVTGIIVMEAPDVERWLAKGQVLLSSLFTIKNDSEKEQITLIKKIAKYGASALIIKKGRFIEQIPTVMINACNKYHLPLIEIPNTVKYTSIEIEVMQLLFNEKALMLEHFYLIHHKFMNFALTQPSLVTMLKELQKLIQNSVVLIDNERQIICTTDTNITNCAEKILSTEFINSSDINYNYTKEKIINLDNKKQYIKYLINFPIIGNAYHSLVIYTQERQLSLSDFMAIENAISYFQMESIKNFAISEVKQNYQNDFIDDLLYGRFTSKETMNEALTVLNLSREQQYIIFVVQIIPPDKIVKDATQQKIELQLFVKKFCRNWNQIIYRIRSNRIIFIIPDPSTSISELKEKIRGTLLYIQKNGSQYYRVGIGNACHVDDFAKLSSQPLQVLQLGNILFNHNYIMHYNDLGIYKVLGDLSSQIDIDEMIPNNLLLLYKKNDMLVKTLQVFLETNQNYKKSAEILFIHPKTMKYRIEKLEKMLNIDFTNAQQTALYLFGLYILKMKYISV